MKAIRFYFSILLVWVVGLSATAQNTMPKFTINYNGADTTSTFKTGISFIQNGNQYSLSDNGQFQDQFDLSKIRSITRYYEPPTVHVYSEETGTDMMVDEVQEDGTVVLSSDTETIPKEGEIIVSGITDTAPYGFLYRVEKVEKSNGQVVLKTSQAYLNEVLPNAHVEQRLQLREVGQGSNIRKKIFMQNGPMKAEEFELFHFKKKWNLYEYPGNKFNFGNVEIKEYVKADINVDMSIGGTLIYDSDGGIPDRFGVTLDGNLSLSATLEAAIKAEYEKKFFDVELTPIEFMVGPVPVVIVPELVWKFGLRTAEGKIYAKWKPIDIETCGFDAWLIYNKKENIYGENWDYGKELKSDFSDYSLNKFFDGLKNMEAGLEGEVKFSIWPELNFKPYGLENVSLSIGLSPYAKVSGELAVKWKSVDNSALLYNDDLEIKDNLSLSVGLDIPLDGKVEFNILGWKIGGSKGTSLTLFDKNIIQGAALVPVFNNFSIYPEDNAKTRDNVHISADRGGTIAGIFDDYEDDYGFCMAQVKKDSQGKELPKEWTYYSMKSKYAHLYGLYPQFKIETDIPTSGLQSNATYEVRPYTVLKVGSSPYYFWRKGGKFQTGGTDGGVTIIDVPGEDF